MKPFFPRLTLLFALALGGVFSAPLPAEPAPADALSGASFDLADVRSMQYRDLASDDVGDRENLQEEARPGDFVFAFEETGKNEAYLRIVLPLAEALRIAFPDRRVIVRRIPSHGFAQTVKAERIPFVISTAGSMVSLIDDSGAIPLAVRERSLGGDAAAQAAGGLLIVDARRKDLGSLSSLRGEESRWRAAFPSDPGSGLRAASFLKGSSPKGISLLPSGVLMMFRKSSTLWRRAARMRGLCRYALLRP